MDPRPGEPVEPFESPAAFEKWLKKHHASATVVWIKMAKKSSGLPSITWTQAVDVALCYGWIDGQSKSLGETWAIQRFTPRAKRSKWSKLNRERVARLTEAGRMRPAGLAEVERAKADGRWDAAYEPASRLTVPDDLAAALAASKKAAALFAKLDAANRYAILYRVGDAKKPETRARRIADFVAMLERGETPHPRRGPSAR
jgi:uncharacterized protein YdeI (YjbR/CyaY-like superfamily)